MARAPLSTGSPTVVKRFKLPGTLAQAFARRCDELDIGESHKLRQLVESWLRQTDAVARQKKWNKK